MTNSLGENLIKITSTHRKALAFFADSIPILAVSRRHREDSDV
ncbi:hypothetical protein [Coleofasciculus chthonoplastes]